MIDYIKVNCQKCGSYDLAYEERMDSAGRVFVGARCRKCDTWRAVPLKKNENKRKANNSFLNLKYRLLENAECKRCHSKDNLEIHHIFPFCIDKTLEAEEWNVMVLCKNCHLLIHSDKYPINIHYSTLMEMLNKELDDL